MNRTVEIIGDILNGYVTDNNGLTFQATVILADYESENEAAEAACSKAEQSITSYYSQGE